MTAPELSAKGRLPPLLQTIAIIYPLYSPLYVKICPVNFLSNVDITSDPYIRYFTNGPEIRRWRLRQ